jgi:hypothetical protein
MRILKVIIIMKKEKEELEWGKTANLGQGKRHLTTEYTLKLERREAISIIRKKSN